MVARSSINKTRSIDMPGFQVMDLTMGINPGGGSVKGVRCNFEFYHLKTRHVQFSDPYCIYEAS